MRAVTINISISAYVTILFVILGVVVVVEMASVTLNIAWNEIWNLGSFCRIRRQPRLTNQEIICTPRQILGLHFVRVF